MDRFSKSEVSQLVALRRKTIGKCEEGCSDGWISKGKEQIGVDFKFTEEQERFRQEVRDFL